MTNDNEDLVRVGPGTVMGTMMRKYWIPAAMSSEIVRDGPPVRLMLLGERLLGFRDSTGKVGIVDHRCPHRGASLFFGRNEECGLRCVYHGWKFDTDGNCVDMPNVPGGNRFKDNITLKAYPTAERNGLIWVFMSETETPPPLPEIEAATIPEGSVFIQFIQRECNWLQSLEGDIDTAHFGFLHAGSVDPADVPDDHPILRTITNKAAEFTAYETEFGTQYAAFRDAEDDQTYWRFANFMFPFWTQHPQGPFSRNVNARAWVPMDDTHTMHVNIYWLPADAPSRSQLAALKDGKSIGGWDADLEFLPNTTDWFGRWRPAANASNDFMIDRDAQASGHSFTGIENIHMQDQAVTESMGPIVDHSIEHLMRSDIMIGKTRKTLLRAARALKETGELPPGVGDPTVYTRARSGFLLADKQLPHTEVYEQNFARAVHPQLSSQDAA